MAQTVTAQQANPDFPPASRATYASHISHNFCKDFAFDNALSWASPSPLALTTNTQGHLTVTKDLLADAGRRACVKSMAKDGSTALHLAAAAGHDDAVQLLLGAGARPDARDRVSAHRLGLT